MNFLAKVKRNELSDAGAGRTGRRTLPETGRSNPQQADESKREKAERKTVPKKSKSRKSWKTSVPHQGKYGLKKKLTVISSKCGQDINAKSENPSAISD